MPRASSGRAYGAAAYAPLDLVDIAAVAAKTLLEDGHHGQKYAMTGPESLSKVEKVRIIGEVLGREIRFVEIGHEEARAEMLALGYGEAADWLLDGDAQMVGRPQPVLPPSRTCSAARPGRSPSGSATTPTPSAERYDEAMTPNRGAESL